jgi:ubiquinone/menaquinone biosynthesis C-methylase UbiE
MSTNLKEKILEINNQTCPWWLCFTFDNPIRRLLHNPEQILGGLIGPGQTAADIGCGMGYFAIPMARLVGEGGRVVAIDLQTKMLDALKRRAAHQNVDGRIHYHLAQPDRIGLAEPVDFVLAFWMVHEVKTPETFLAEIKGMLKQDGRFLMVEPMIHVSQISFEKSVAIARSVGLEVVARPEISISRAALLVPDKSHPEPGAAAP